MKFRIIIAMLTFSALVSCQGQNQGGVKNLPKPDKQVDQVSYIIGMDIGTKMRLDSLEINPEYLFLGFMNGLKNADSLMTAKETEEAMMKFQEDMSKKQQARMEAEYKAFQESGERYKVEGPKFLEANKKKPGVIVTPSGLQFKVIKEGTGPNPTMDDNVIIHLIGKFIDGKEFDNTHQRSPNPQEVGVKDMVGGFLEALKMMKAGGKYEVVVPSNLAYGEQGAGKIIPPNAVLVYEVELHGVKSKAQVEAENKERLKQQQQQPPNQQELQKQMEEQMKQQMLKQQPK